MTPRDLIELLPQSGQSDVGFEQAAIGMAMVDFEGQFLRVNGALCELVGRTEPELLTMRWQDITHPEDIDPGEQEVTKTLARNDRTFRLAKRYFRPDGVVLWVLLSVSLIRSEDGEPLCLFTQAVDVTEQRRAEEGVARLAAIVESSDDAILSTALDGTVLTWNGAAERMYGYTATEIVGKDVASIVPLDRRDELKQLLAAVARGESISNHETVRVRKDGSRVDVSVTISPIRDGRGNVVRASTIVRDITDQKRMVERLDATLHALEAALDEARAAEQRSHRFLSDAAHHLRNPVAGIRSCVETIFRGCPQVERERLVSEVVRNTAQVSRLVDRLLRMSRLDDQASLVLEPDDLGRICEDAVERARSLAPRLEITITAEPVPPVSVDRAAVREMLTGLLDNARRYAERRIDVSVAQSGSMAVVLVVDDGQGLAPSEVEQAFEPFMSIDGSGSGLGLAYSRSVAAAHGGDLDYDDGAFVVRLPLSRTAVPDVERSEENAAPAIIEARQLRPNGGERKSGLQSTPVGDCPA